MQRSRRERRLDLWLVVGGLILVCALAATAFAALTDAGPFEDEPFDCGEYSLDQGEWADDSHRLEDANALVRCHSLIGMDEGQVRSMLGAEDFSDGGRLYFLVYSDIDATHLVLFLDKGGQVKRADVVTG